MWLRENAGSAAHLRMAFSKTRCTCACATNAIRRLLVGLNRIVSKSLSTECVTLPQLWLLRIARGADYENVLKRQCARQVWPLI